MAEVLLIERRDGVATLTMNRPESMNSLSDELKAALLAALAEVASDTAVRAVVLTGSGRGFCVGQDLAEHAERLRTGDAAPLETVRRHYNPITLALSQLPKPSIAAINGVAAGAGASLAFACDLRVMSSQARLLLAFANVGLGLDTGASWTLPRLIGSARALELSLLAQPIGAEVAAGYGLVTEVVEPADVGPAAQVLAARLAAGPTLAYAAIKQAIDFGASHDLADSLEREAELQVMLGRSADHRNAVEAFVNKQKPTFTGR